MNIESLSGEYASAFGTLCFKVEQAPETPTDVEVLINSEVAGVKRFYTSDFTVNAATFVRRRLEVKPLVGASRFVQCGTRTARYAVRIGDTLSEQHMATAARCAPSPLRLLSDSKRRVIAPGQRDEIAFLTSAQVLVGGVTVVLDGGTSTTVPIDTFSAQSGQVALVIDMDDIETTVAGLVLDTTPTINSMQAVVGFADGTNLTVDYTVTPRTDGVRMAWVNRYGAADYFTFPTVRSVEKRVERSKIYSTDGFRTVSQSLASEMTLSSGLMPKVDVEWLADIITSPEVWRVEGSAFEAVDVTTTRVVTSADHAPQAVEITIRPRQYEISQLM